MSEQLSRRSVGKGVAWAIPAVTVFGAAPAIAASPGAPQPNVVVSDRTTYNSAWYSEATETTNNYKFFSTTPGSTVPGEGVGVQNTTATTTVTDITITIYLPTPDAVFFAGPEGAAGWTTLAYNGSIAPKSFNGDTYYPYTTTYTQSLPSQPGSMFAQPFSFESQDNLPYTGAFFEDVSMVVDGQPWSDQAGPLAIVGA